MNQGQQRDRIKMSIMTTRSNAMPSPLLFSKEAEDDINGGFSRNGGVNIKP